MAKKKKGKQVDVLPYEKSFLNCQLIVFTSPYTEPPVELLVGPDRLAYFVPRHMLPSEWNKTGLERRLCLAETDQEIGHTLVHYLYSKDYETLDVVAESPLSEAYIQFTRALLVYIMTVKYNGLNSLRDLAIREMEDHGSRMTICQALGAIKDHFSKLESPSWIHDYVCKRVKVAFAEDHTVFKSTTFLEIIGNVDYDKFMMRCVMDSYDERIAQMAEAEKAFSERLNQQRYEARDTLVRCSDPEEKKGKVEELILPHVDEAIEKRYGREVSEQCSISIGDPCTTECSSLECAASICVEETPSPEESCCSNISVVDYPDEPSEAELRVDNLRPNPERVISELEEKGKNAEVAGLGAEGNNNAPPETAVVERENVAGAETRNFELEHVSELGAELDLKLQPCSRQAEHMLEERRWRECKLCRAMLHKIAVQLVQAP
ncbi:hypothetical protein N0V94_003755 [Neodidymelliopsis sp. IMI 364377]|nr:hypothetical protein N0V94_003755 [Neodidymelliopsis sp. IMI 364377]